MPNSKKKQKRKVEPNLKSPYAQDLTLTLTPRPPVAKGAQRAPMRQTQGEAIAAATPLQRRLVRDRDILTRPFSGGLRKFAFGQGATPSSRPPTAPQSSRGRPQSLHVRATSAQRLLPAPSAPVTVCRRFGRRQRAQSRDPGGRAWQRQRKPLPGRVRPLFALHGRLDRCGVALPAGSCNASVRLADEPGSMTSRGRLEGSAALGDSPRCVAISPLLTSADGLFPIRGCYEHVDMSDAQTPAGTQIIRSMLEADVCAAVPSDQYP